MSWPPSNDFLPEDADLPDYDVDADMLANAANDGIAISQAPIAVRRRAVLEKGLRPFFHGGWMSALCIDMRYDDSRSDEEQAWARMAAVAARDPDDPLGENEVPDISFTMAEDGMEVSSPVGWVGRLCGWTADRDGWRR